MLRSSTPFTNRVVPAYYITIEHLVARLDRAVRGGQLQPHLVARALDECGFEYDPMVRAFYVRSDMAPAREEEQRIYEEKLNADLRSHGKIDTGLLRGASRTVGGDTPGQPMNRLVGAEADYGGNGGVRAMPARDVLRQRAFELRRKAAHLDALASAIPENFPHDADAALMDLATSVRVY